MKTFTASMSETTVIITTVQELGVENKKSGL
jgi:hypothetical protein